MSEVMVRKLIHPRRLLLIDGLNCFIRSWIVNPLMNSNGDHVGGAIGMLRSIKTNIRDLNPSRVIVVWDGEGGSQKRRGVYSQYKMGRKPRVNRHLDDDPQVGEQNLKMQYAKVRELLDLVGVSQIEVNQVEADDVIGYVCHMFPQDEKVIVSTDKDMLQLIDVRTLVYSPSKKKLYGAALLKEEYSVLPENFVYFKALTGDASDNVKGIKGFGPATVAKLFPFLGERASDSNEILSYAEEHKDKSSKYKVLIENRDVLIGNVQLMQLSTPIIGSQSISAIRYALEKSVSFSPSELKLSLIKDGIQLTDADFFQVFREYQLRFENVEKKGATENVAG
ncbi:MAG: hypothetical protein ACYDHY_06775 [Acidiferrobacterales bacterium]